MEPNVRKSVTLPEPHNEEERWYCNRLINEALHATRLNGGGPVHINVPISEPLFEYNVPQLPDERMISLHPASTDDTYVYEMTTNFFSGTKPMIGLGQHNPSMKY